MPTWARCPLLSFLLMIAAGWIHRHQLIVIEFLQTENRLLKERLRGRRIRFTDAERALCAGLVLTLLINVAAPPLPGPERQLPLVSMPASGSARCRLWVG